MVLDRFSSQEYTYPVGGEYSRLLVKFTSEPLIARAKPGLLGVSKDVPSFRPPSGKNQSKSA